MPLIEPRLSDPRTGALPERLDLSSPPPSPPLRDAQSEDAMAEGDAMSMLGDMSAEEGGLGPGSAGKFSRVYSGIAMMLQGANFIAEGAPMLLTPNLLTELDQLRTAGPTMLAEQSQVGGGLQSLVNPMVAGAESMMAPQAGPMPEEEEAASQFASAPPRGAF